MASAPSIRSSSTALVSYGPPKAGKTLDIAASFPNAVFLAGPGALKPCVAELGWEPASIEAAGDLGAMLSYLRGLEKLPAAKRPPAVVLDDVSIATVASEQVYRARFGKDGFAIQNALREDVRNILLTGRGLGIHLFITGHERSPKLDRAQMGGPELGSYALTLFLAGIVDAILRVRGFTGHRGWPQGFTCGTAADGWISGERHGVVKNQFVPLNTREYLLAANRLGFSYSLQRPPGMEWVDEYVDGYAPIIASGQHPDTAVAQHVVGDLTGRGVSPIITKLVLRDLMDRAFYLRPTSPFAAFTG